MYSKAIPFTFAVAGLLAASTLSAEETRQYEVEGLVVKVDAAQGTVFVSHDSIPGFMDAMVMPFRVRLKESLLGMRPGAKIRFSLFVGKESSWIDRIAIVPFDSPAIDPTEVRRFKALERAFGGPAEKVLTEGERVPDFSLIDQKSQKVALSEFVGRVVAINFIYTRCRLPDYCYRLSNNFGRLQKRFVDRLGRDLILLTISFDPVHDQPDILARYAEIWKADSRSWHFLTGPTAEVQRVCGRFGVDAWADEGAMTHSLHTVVIDRNGRLVANIEGNQYTVEQFGDLVETTLSSQP